MTPERQKFEQGRYEQERCLVFKYRHNLSDRVGMYDHGLFTEVPNRLVYCTDHGFLIGRDCQCQTTF